jgi:hypothetical protein
MNDATSVFHSRRFSPVRARVKRMRATSLKRTVGPQMGKKGNARVPRWEYQWMSLAEMTEQKTTETRKVCRKVWQCRGTLPNICSMIMSGGYRGDGRDMKMAEMLMVGIGWNEGSTKSLVRSSRDGRRIQMKVVGGTSSSKNTGRE